MFKPILVLLALSLTAHASSLDCSKSRASQVCERTETMQILETSPDEVFGDDWSVDLSDDEADRVQAAFNLLSVKRVDGVTLAMDFVSDGLDSETVFEGFESPRQWAYWVEDSYARFVTQDLD